MKHGFVTMLRKLRSLFAAVLVCAFVSNAVAADTFKTFDLTYTVDNETARTMLPMINEWRQSGDAWYWKSDGTKYSCGTLSAYSYDYNLEQIALQRAYEAAVNFEHTRPDGSDCNSYTYNGTKSGGENIAIGASGSGCNTAAHVFEMWQENDDDYSGQGHRRAMLSSGYKAIGIAYVQYKGVHCWVQEFGTKNSGAAATTALVGTTTGTVRLNTSKATFSISPDSNISSITYGTSKSLPKLTGWYKTPKTFVTKGIPVPDSDIKNIKWTSGDTTKLVVQNNTTVKAVGAGSTTLSYSATYDGETYTGSMNVTVSRVSISSSDVTYTIPACSYEIGGVTPKPVLKYNGQTLVEGTDYEITRYGSNTYITTNAYAYLTGLGNFTGTRYAYFSITKSDINDCVVSEIPDSYYTGSAITPQISLTYKGAALTKGTHYSVSYSGNVNAGTATATISGINYFEGTRDVTFKIQKQKPENLTFADIADQTYKGSEFTPSLTIKNGARYLTKDTDYTVKYKDNVNAGTASAVITFTGNYTGTKTLNFNIARKPLSGVTVSGNTNKTYTGSPVKQTLTLTNGSVQLAEGTDYTVSYKDNTEVGTATLTLIGSEKNYTGTRELTFKINAVTASMAECTVTGDCVYTGSALTPEFTLKYADAVFVKDTDYTVSYSYNTNAGTSARISITGISTRLTGSAVKYFTITGRSITEAEVSKIANQTYTGSAIKPSVTVKYNGTTLRSGTDYTVAYTDNVDAGTATATITGKGNFNGSYSVKFLIVKPTFDIALKVTGNGEAGLSKTPASEGDKIEVTANPETGYEVESIKFNGTAISGNEFTMTAGKATVEVTFKKGVYSITVKKTGEGTVKLSKTSAYYGDEISLTLEPEEGYLTGTVKADGKTVSGNKFTMPAKNITLEVTFDEIVMTHKLTKVEAKPATCTGKGNIAYYVCEDTECGCKKLYKDRYGQHEITLADTVVPAKGHSLEKTSAKDATCTESGHTEYWKCTACGKLFGDSEGKNEITSASTVVAPLGHDKDHAEHHAEKAPTYNNDGHKEYYQCTRCGKKFSDPDLKNEVSDADLLIPKKGAAVKGEEATVDNIIYRVTYAATDGTGTVSVIGIKDRMESVSIPATVEIKENRYIVNRIATTAFNKDTVLTSVVIGSNVVIIDDNAFQGCSNLVKVTGGAKLKTIGTKAFISCPKLKSFTITSKVLWKIGPYAFYGDKSLKTIYIKNTVKLTKSGVKRSLKGSKVKTVKVKKSKIRKYRKLFKKSNSGRKVKVKK